MPYGRFPGEEPFDFPIPPIILPGGSPDINVPCGIGHWRGIERPPCPSPTFGPIFSPPPPPFGPIYTPPPNEPANQPTVPISQDTFGGRIKRMATFLPGNSRFGLLGGILGAVGSVIGAASRGGLRGIGTPGFEPGQGPTIIPCIPGLPQALGGCGLTTGENTPVTPQMMGQAWPTCPTTRSGRRLKPAQCYVQTKTGRILRGKIKIINGQPCCTPIRHMNVANARALTRAATRLKGFTKLEKRIHKSLRRACGPAGRSFGARRKCGTCRKSKCVC